MNFIERLPRFKRVDTILVMVDRLSKYAHLIGLRHPFIAISMTSVFVKEVVKLHGYPYSIIFYRDKIFVSNFWIELFKL